MTIKTLQENNNRYCTCLHSVLSVLRKEAPGTFGRLSSTTYSTLLCTFLGLICRSFEWKNTIVNSYSSVASTERKVLSFRHYITGPFSMQQTDSTSSTDCLKCEDQSDMENSP